MNNTVKTLESGDFEVLLNETIEDTQTAKQRRDECGFTPADLVAFYGEDHR